MRHILTIVLIDSFLKQLLWEGYLVHFKNY